MTTVRSHDQFNTTIYGLSDRYRGVYNGRRVIFMTEEDLKTAASHGQLVDRTSYHRNEKRIARHFMVAPSRIARGCTATYFPEANVLVSINSSADRSNTPASRSVVISTEPSTNTAAAVDQIRREARL